MNRLPLLLVLLAPALLHASPVVDGKRAPTHAIAGGKGRATLLLHPGTGSKEAALTILQLDPGAAVPEHTHDDSVEILYVEAGTVDMIIDGKPASAGPGDAIHIPKGVKHSAVVKGTEALRAVQVYVGPGPEQRFTKGPRVDGK